MDDEEEKPSYTPKLRGFATQDPETRRKTARKGGSAVPAERRSFYQDRELAANAGRKGGTISRGGGRRPTPKP